MHCIKTNDDIKSLGTILGIWAHPDDETFAMGGIMFAAVQNGQEVVCITATRGEAGVQDESRWPAAQLGAIREKEMEDACRCLGITEHHWLGYPDGRCAAVDEDEAVSRLASFIHQYHPDSIFTFGPDGMTGHEDHKTVSRWAAKAARLARSHAAIYQSIQTNEQYDAMREADDKFNIFFNIDKPDVCASDECAVCFELDDDAYAAKMQALRAMPSQTEAILALMGDSLRAPLGTEAFTDRRDA